MAIVWIVLINIYKLKSDNANQIKNKLHLHCKEIKNDFVQKMYDAKKMFTIFVWLDVVICCSRVRLVWDRTRF